MYRAEGFQALSKVEVRANSNSILAVLNVIDDARLVGERELGLSEEAFGQLQISEGDTVHVAHAEPPRCDRVPQAEDRRGTPLPRGADCHRP